MSIIGYILCVLIFVLIQTLYNDLKDDSSTNNTTIDVNLTLTNLISDSILESWITNSTKSENVKLKFRKSIINNKNNATELLTSSMIQTTTSKNLIQDESEDQESDSERTEVSSNARNVSFEDIMKTLFNPPVEEVEPDWPVVLGTFYHCGDENWKEFLIKTEIPMIIRMVFSEISETVEITRDLKKMKMDQKQKKYKNNSTVHSDYEITLTTSSWFSTHHSKFRLGELIIEEEFDGTISNNTFFFSNPRLLIHNKVKESSRTAVVRHFNETGLNMTLVDIDRMVMARRFFKRDY